MNDTTQLINWNIDDNDVLHVYYGRNALLFDISEVYSDEQAIMLLEDEIAGTEYEEIWNKQVAEDEKGDAQ